MGGNALAEFGAKRVNKDIADAKVDQLISRVDQIAKQHGISIRCEPIMAYRNKADFGDIDMLVESSLFKLLPPKEIVSALQSDYVDEIHWIKNGPVLSVGLPLTGGGCLQADLISTDPIYFDFSAGYFAWNDLGNLVGRIAHKMGLKFGHDGLWMQLRDGTNLFDKILVTRDFDQALDFLGYDAKVWQKGFDSVEDIYRFTASGSRFNPSIYQLENRNHTARVRDRKRPVYMGFLAWMEEQEGLGAFQWNPDKLAYLDEIFTAFPGAEKDYELSVQKLEKSKAFKKSFNGDIVGQVTGLKGKELGHFIKEFRMTHAKLLENIEDVSEGDMRQAIRRFQDQLVSDHNLK